MPKSYRVEWVIDMTADSPEEAAKMAMSIMRDNSPKNTATVFTCYDETGAAHDVDLLEKEEDDYYA